jgi:hypothetical protein
VSTDNDLDDANVHKADPNAAAPGIPDSSSARRPQDRRYRLLAQALGTVVVLFFLTMATRLAADALSRSAGGPSPFISFCNFFADSLLNTPQIGYLVCGFVGALIAEVHRDSSTADDTPRLMCYLLAGSISGLMLPYSIQAGVAAVQQAGVPPDANVSPSTARTIFYLILAAVGGYAGKRVFEWLTAKVIGGDKP